MEEEKKTVVEQDNEKVEETVEKDSVDTPEPEKTDEPKEVKEEQEADKGKEPVVEQTEEVGNGLDVNDLVTKDLLSQMFSAFEAKLDAVINENKSLKDELANTKSKYEGHDFGTEQKRGVQQKARSANDTFEEYSKQFM